MEYSIDQGATWLPVVYLLEGSDVIRDGQGNIDAVATFGTVRIGDFEGQATYLDPVTTETRGGYYGAFIGVDSNRWSQLGPFISARVDNNPAESKRVEVFRLFAADNQSKVRLRFAHAGTDSWYFGIDDVGFYSISNINPPTVAITPTNQIDAVGNSITVQSTTVGIGPFTYQWKRNGLNVPGQANAALTITNLRSSDAGTYTLEIGYPGASAIYGTSVMTIIDAPAYVVGQWDFDNADLSANCGQPLQYFDPDVGNNTGFAGSDFFALPQLDNQEVSLMAFPGVLPGALPMGGYKMRHGLAGNGGGTNLNQYTLIADIIYPASSHDQFRSLLQTDPNNADDGEFFIGPANGIGVNSVYHGSLLPNTWYRIALAVDLSDPGPSPIVAKFINGVKVGQQILPAGRDGRWSLSASPDQPWALLFADNDVDVQPGYVSSIQLRSGRLPDAAVAWLGGPSASKIPGCIAIGRSGGQLVIRWSGGVLLESADAMTGPWTEVIGATSPHNVSTAAPRKFYRPKLWPQ